MLPRWSRREFLGSVPAAGLLYSAARAGSHPETGSVVPDWEGAAVRPEIEPLVRWIEETPRERIIDGAIGKIQKEGLAYRDLLAGIFLAAIRTIKPRPVGYKFHAVMAVHSAHLLGQTGPRGDDVLAMLWALDNYKNSQEQDRKEGDWTLSRVDEARVPTPSKAHELFAAAMDEWDSDKADTATAGLARSAGAADVMEAFFAYGIRDQRNIGHKPIFTMQCWRTLQAIGWQHAEPVLRSLAFGLLDLQGDSTRAPSGPYAENRNRAGQFRDDWSVGTCDQAATLQLLAAMRQGTPDEVGAEVVKLINAGTSPGSLWDAVALAGAEMLLNAPGILALHAVTSANALHYIGGASSSTQTRRLCLLQAASWMPLYRARLQTDRDLKLDTLEPEPVTATTAAEVREALSDALSSDRQRAARQVLSLGGNPAGIQPAFDLVRQLIVSRGNDSHQYKYGVAAWEESSLVTDPRWRAPVLAATMAYAPSPPSGQTRAFSAWQEAQGHA